MPEPPHPTDVDEGVNQGVESHGDDVSQQPDVLLEEDVVMVRIQEVLAGHVHLEHIARVVNKDGQVEEDVDGGDNYYSNCCFPLHLGHCTEGERGFKTLFMKKKEEVDCTCKLWTLVERGG